MRHLGRRPAARVSPRRRLGARPQLHDLEKRTLLAGNILVTTGYYQALKEFTPEGVKVRDQSIGGGDSARDLVVTSDGAIHNYNGTFSPTLYTLPFGSPTWTGRTFPGWSTVANGSYGGLAQVNGVVFASDMTTYGSTAEQLKGIVRFDLASNTTSRFATTIEPIDLNAGLDGKLYALDGYGTITVFDPATSAQVGQVTLGPGGDYRAVAADASGNLYIATWGNLVQKFSPSGALQATLDLNNRGFISYGLEDIDVDTDGEIIVGTWGGTVVRTTTALAGVTSFFPVGTTGDTFVTFAKPASTPPPPTPSITIADAATLEGDSGPAPLNFVVRLSNASLNTVTVAYTTVAGSATPLGKDFEATKGTLTFAPGETIKTISVAAIGDLADEKNETFNVSLSNPTNATIARRTALGTIADDDPDPVGVSFVSAPSAVAVLRDFTGSGTFTEQTAGTDALLVRKFDFAVPAGIPRDERSVIEFDTSSVSPQDVTGATLQLYCYTTTSQTTSIDVYGYAADGVATLADATRPAVLLANIRFPGTGIYSLPLDLAGLLSVMGTTGKVGIRLSGTPNANVGFYGTSWGVNQPKLTLDASLTPPELSVSDLTVNEGGYADFVVSLSRPLSTAFTVGYFTTEGTALSGTGSVVDFIGAASSNGITFNPGETQKTVRVATVSDSVAEGPETFTLTLYNATANVTYARNGVGTATILDVANPTPGVRVADATVAEGNSGNSTASFTITLSVASASPVTVSYATADGSAAAGDDYQATSGTVTFAPDETSKTVGVPVFGDTTYERNESFSLQITGSSATILRGSAVGLITNDEAVPLVSIGNATITEGNAGSTQAVFTVTLSTPSAFTTIVTYGTADGTAKVGADYDFAGGQLLFGPGQTSQQISVTVFGDTFTEANESFTVVLSPNVVPQGDAMLGQGTGTATIIDDDPGSGTMAFVAGSWGEAQDNDLNGSYDRVSVNPYNIPVGQTTAFHSAGLFEFDVSRVVAGSVTSVTLDLAISSYTSNGGPVNVVGYAGDGTVALADVGAAGTFLGSFQPDSLGRRSITLDRSAVLALTLTGGKWLGIRLEPAASYVNTSVYGAAVSPDNAPALVFRSDGPSANPDSYATPEDAALNVPASSGVLANDGKPAGSTVTAVLASGPLHGSLTLAADGSFVYTPAANYNGLDSFTYRASDGTSLSAVATVSLHVTPVNDAPVASNGSASTDEDAPVAVLLTASDVEGNSLTYSIVAGPTHGTLSGSGANLTYTPAANYNGPDSFTFRASDGSLNSANATISINVRPVNDAPVAANDSYATDEDTALTVIAPGVLGNDTDVDGNPLTAVVGTGPAHGTLALDPSGRFVYTPAPNYSGQDSFTYRASDGTATSALATVSLTVRPVNDAPVASNDFYTVSKNGTLSIAAPGLLANDTDADGDRLTALIATTPTSGSLSFKSDGSFVYTPKKNFTGTAQFTYRAKDALLTSNLATVTITVSAGRNLTGAGGAGGAKLAGGGGSSTLAPASGLGAAPLVVIPTAPPADWGIKLPTAPASTPPSGTAVVDHALALLASGPARPRRR